MGEDDLTPAEPLSAPARAGERRARFLSWLTPHLMPVVKAWLPPFLALLAAAAQHWAGKAETDKKLGVSYETLAPATNTHAKEIEDLKKSVVQLADSVQVLQALALANRPGFSALGTPEKPAAVKPRARHAAVLPAADPRLVKKLQDNEAKNLKLTAHLKAEVPPAPAVPTTLPAEVPQVRAAVPPPAPSPPAQEWPPPVPAQAQPGGASP